MTTELEALFSHNCFGGRILVKEVIKVKLFYLHSALG